jgi:DNA-binding CsgD family transcriptional regulator
LALAAQTRRTGRCIIDPMLDHATVAYAADRSGPAPIRGRDSEREQLVETLTQAARGRASAALIDSEPGAGRTRLLQEATVLARRLGLRVLPLQALLDQDPQAPSAIVVDDLHRLEPEDTAALASARRRLDQRPVAWIVAANLPQCTPAQRALADELRRAGKLIVLSPLAPEAITAMVADRVAGTAGPQLAELADAAEGNAGLLITLVDGLIDEDRLRRTGRVVELHRAGLPDALIARVADQVAQQRADTGQVVRVAAALGSTFTAAQVGQMLDRSPAQVMDPIGDAIAAGLIVDDGDRLRFRHGLVREALLLALPTSVRRGLRRQAADVLIACGGGGIEVAEQLADGAEIGDHAAARRILDTARDLTAWDADRAAGLAQRAVDIAALGAPDRARMVADAIVMLRAARRHGEAEELGLRALAQPLSAADESAIRLALSTLDEQVWSVERLEHNRRAVGDCDPAPVPRARHLAWLAHNLAVAGRSDAVPDAAARARQAAHEAGDAAAGAVATVALALDAWQSGDPATAARHLRSRPRLGATSDELGAAQLARLADAHVSAVLGRLDAATRIATEELAGARRNRQPWQTARWSVAHAFVDLLAGRLRDAERHALEADLGSADQHGPDAVTARLVLVCVAHRTGDPSRLRAAADAGAAALDLQPRGSLAHRHARWLQALTHVALRDQARGAAMLRAAVEAGAPLDPGWYVEAARAATAAADQELANAVIEATSRWMTGAQSPVLASVAFHARGVIDSDAGLLRTALDAARAHERPLLRAAILEDLAAQQVRGGAVREAIAGLEEAHAIVRSAGAETDGLRIGDELARLGVRRALPAREGAKGWDALTGAELRVARLVGAGATNREAARRLYVSPHTVSSHLRSAFAKLEINSRVELARLVMLHEGAG